MSADSGTQPPSLINSAVVRVAEKSPGLLTVTFDNPPVNLFDPEVMDATAGSPDREPAFDRHRSRSKRQQLLISRVRAPGVDGGPEGRPGGRCAQWTAGHRSR
jgi:hypothetical protein